MPANTPKGFSPLSQSKPSPKRLILGLEGSEKAGKTTFALSAPCPIAYIDADDGTEGVIDKIKDQGKEVYITRPFRSRKLASKTSGYEAVKLEMEEILNAYFNALESPDIRTVIMDTDTEIWKLLRLARTGKVSPADPLWRQIAMDLGQEFRGLISAAKGTDKNLIMIGRLKDEWATNETDGKDYRTGRKVRDGYTQIGFEMTVMARMSVQYFPYEEDEEPEPPEFSLKVLSCRRDPRLTGREFRSSMCSFSTLAMSIFPGTTRKDWK